MTRATVNSKPKVRSFIIHEDAGAEWGEFIVAMDGRLDGFTCHVRFELVDGRICVGEICYRPSAPMPLDAATVRSLRDLRLGDMPGEAEECVRFIAKLDRGLDWLEAFEATRRRPGRGGRASLLAARVAVRRIEAEELAPGKAIRYMVKTWPDEFVSESAAHSKVNKAIHATKMLERVDGTLQLTQLAKSVLEGTKS